MSSAARPCGPSRRAAPQAVSSGPNSPARSRRRSSAAARSAGSSAAVQSRCAMTAEVFSRREPPSLAACQGER
eukprot:7849308-Alexandrium_andersonii.AAC.1